MTENKVSDLRTVWVSFLDDNGQQVDGFFKLIEQAQSYVKLLSGKNVLTIPYHKVNKIKETLVSNSNKYLQEVNKND